MKEIELLNLREELKRFQSKIKDLSDKKSIVAVDNVKSEQWLKSRTALQYQSPARLQSPTVPEYDNPSAALFNSDKLRFNNY